MKAKHKAAKRKRKPPAEDPRDVALRGAYRHVHELRAALRLVFEFYERPREMYGVDDVLAVKAARAIAFSAQRIAFSVQPPKEEKHK